MTKYHIIGCILLIAPAITVAKYSDSIYLGGAQNSGAVDSIVGSNAIDLGSLPEFIQSGPSYQAIGGANVPAAIQTKRTVEVKPVNIPQEPIEPHVVDVEATYQPVHVVFRSSSSPVLVQQIHTPAQPSPSEPTQSEDEPHRVQHQVMRPVIQEVREIIQPYRRVLQEVRPVLEQVHTVVARQEGAAGRAAAGGEGVLYTNGAALGANGAIPVGSGYLSAGAGYASAAASVPAPTYAARTRQIGSSTTTSAGGNARATSQLKTNQRSRRLVSAAKRQHMYASTL